jgi:hypothetical protein
MADDRLEVEIVLDDGSIQKGFANLKSEGKKAGSQLGKSFASVATSFAKIGAVAGVAATAIAGVFGVKAIRAAAQQEVAVNKLNTALRLAGEFSNEASRGIQDFASELQAATTIGDETTLELFSLARTFTKSNEEAQKLTKAAVELSAATGLTLDGSVKNLGKTFAGLTGELGESLPALRNLSAESLKSGKALDFVLERFGGAAAAQVNTFEGSISQLSNVFGDFLEKIGGFVTGSPEFIALIKTISQTISGFSKSISSIDDGSDPFKGLIEGAIEFGLIVNKFLVAPVELAVNVISFAFDQIVTNINAGITSLASTGAKLVSFFAPDSDLAQGLKTFAESSKSVFDESAAASQASLEGIFNFDQTAGVESFLEQFRTNFETIRGEVEAQSKTLGESVKGGLKETQEEVKKATFDIGTRLGNGISSAVQSTVKALQNGENAFAAFGKAVLGVFGDLAIQLGQFFIIQGIAVEALKSLGGAAAVAAGIALVALGTLLKGLSGGEGGVGGGSSATPGSVGAPNDSAGPGVQPDEEVERSTAVTVNVEGTVLDPIGVGTQIANLLDEVTDSNDITVNA